MTEAGPRDKSKTGSRAFVAFSLLVWASMAASADDNERGRRPPRAMSPELRVAQSLAFNRLRQGQNCRELFEAQGADGVVLLKRATFRTATAIERSEICQRRRAVLFTTLHGTEIGLCPKEFSKLGSSHRAALLIHEALHHAGVSEQPFDPQALSSTQLTRLVEKQCHLSG